MTTEAETVVYLAKRLLQTDPSTPLFLDRLNDLSVAVWEYEQAPGLPARIAALLTEHGYPDEETGTTWYARSSGDAILNDLAALGSRP